VYSVFLSLAIAVLIGFSGVFLFDGWAWYWAILFTLLAFVAVWILIARRLGARLQPAMGRLQKQMEAGHLDAAMETLEALLPLAKWVPMLKGQLLAQMGMLAWHGNKKDKALQLLEGASVRAADARLLLGAILHVRGDTPRALAVLQLAAAVNKKHALLHNTWAWILHKSERHDDAQKVLAAFNKRDPGNEPTKDNLLRLQNRTRMTMHGFGMQWFALGLEQPPQQMGQMRRAPKGFREPPKSRG
jgi:tetratricopeptide (TPR) repeat protein